MNARPASTITVVSIAGEDVPVELRRNARAKRLILRIDRSTRCIKVTAPLHSREKDISRFINQHLGWIEQERANISPAESVHDGARVPYMGRACRVCFTGQPPRRVSVRDDTIEIGGPADQAPARLERWMREQARYQLMADAQYYADMLGVSFARLSIGDMKTRWGSCSSKKTLKFNWRLIMAPENVRRYVAAHEVAHLLEMNHSDRFWRHVKTCMPDYKVQRRWLKKDGDGLMLIRLRA